VTDANLILGRLSPAGLLGGQIPLDAGAARAAFTPLAECLGFTIERTAHGVLDIVVANTVRAIRAMTVERGHDPRRFALLAFGGAGPLHASDVARGLRIREVIVPLAPGLLCAQGLVISDQKEDFVRPARTHLNEAHLGQMWEHMQVLTRTAEAWIAAEKLLPERCAMQVTLDMRYVGEDFAIAVPLDTAGLASLSAPEAVTHIRALVFEAHEMAYGYHNPDDPLEIINYRLCARSRLHHAPEVTPAASVANVPEPVGTRQISFHPEVARETPVFERARLVPGHVLIGPAVIDQFDATTLIYPGDGMRVDEALNLIIEISS
jgi:N-methylhydantoinase A